MEGTFVAIDIEDDPDRLAHLDLQILGGTGWAWTVRSAAQTTERRPASGARWSGIHSPTRPWRSIRPLGERVERPRTLRGPVFVPLRALAAGYTDLFRGIPLIILLYLIGFGVPGLRLQGVPTSAVVLGTTAMVLTYSAYVAEVFRAGIDSVHPSQRAAARSLGLTYRQSMRLVVLPYAHEHLDLSDPALVWLLRAARLLVGALTFVVAINLAILFYARTISRLAELAVRTALGAGRRRILSQLFVEAWFLSGAHTERDVNATIKAAREVMKVL